MSEVNTEIEARESSKGAKLISHKHPPNTQNLKNTASNNVSSASTLVTNKFKSQRADCEGAQFLALCNKVLNMKERSDIPLKTGRCLN